MSVETRDRELTEASEESLEVLYELREELKLVARSDCAYARYAANGLERLREAGYDV